MLVVMITVLAVPAVHWRLWGWIRGEAFFDGRPTSYWEREVARLEPYYSMSWEFYFPMDNPFMGLGGLPGYSGSSWSVKEWIIDTITEKLSSSPAKLPGWILVKVEPPRSANGVPQVDDTTLPVLRELLKSDHVYVRRAALRVLRVHFLPETDVFKEALHDAALDVRLEAAIELRYPRDEGDLDSRARIRAIETNMMLVEVTAFLQGQPLATLVCSSSNYVPPPLPLPKALVSVFIQGLKHPDPAARDLCAAALGDGGAEAKSAVPALREALREASDESSELTIKAALRKLAPETP